MTPADLFARHAEHVRSGVPCNCGIIPPADRRFARLQEDCASDHDGVCLTHGGWFSTCEERAQALLAALDAAEALATAVECFQGDHDMREGARLFEDVIDKARAFRAAMAGRPAGSVPTGPEG